MNTTMVFNQAPTNAGADAMNQPLAGQQSGSIKQQPLGFKKKLENCIAIDESPYGVPIIVNQTGNSQDNSMATASPAQQVPNEIVGILEGFGLLDYRSYLPQVPSESGTEAETSAKAAEILLQGMTQNTEQTGTLEKYARMLSKDQLSQLPEDMQQAILKAVGDYLGSFESTNKKPVQTTAAQDVPQALTPGTIETTPAAAAADTAALPDKIAGLLLKLKAVTQDTKPAQSVQRADSVISSDVSPVSTDIESQAVLTESVDSVTVLTKQEKTTEQAGIKMVQTSDIMVQADEAAMQTDEAKLQTHKSKAPAADELPQQASKTDMPVQTSAQSHVTTTQNTDTVQTKADMPQTAQTDFVKDNVMRIVDKLSTEVSDGKYDFDVELKPEFLGKVSIKLTMENGEIRMQIKTDDIGVKGMFAEQVSSMQAVLKDKGIAVTNIDITYQSQMQTGDDRQAYRQNSSGGKRQSSRTGVSLENLAGTGMFDTMTEITGYTHTGSSVEYLA